MSSNFYTRLNNISYSLQVASILVSITTNYLITQNENSNIISQAVIITSMFLSISTIFRAIQIGIGQRLKSNQNNASLYVEGCLWGSALITSLLATHTIGANMTISLGLSLAALAIHIISDLIQLKIIQKCFNCFSSFCCPKSPSSENVELLERHPPLTAPQEVELERLQQLTSLSPTQTNRLLYLLELKIKHESQHAPKPCPFTSEQFKQLKALIQKRNITPTETELMQILLLQQRRQARPPTTAEHKLLIMLQRSPNPLTTTQKRLLESLLQIYNRHNEQQLELINLLLLQPNISPLKKQQLELQLELILKPQDTLTPEQQQLLQQ